MFTIQTNPVKVVVQNKTVCVLRACIIIHHYKSNNNFFFKIIVFPGERIGLSIIAYDEYNSTVGIAVTLSDSKVMSGHY